jgi:glycosyltransferase involved in cell wall biosynthesis
MLLSNPHRPDPRVQLEARALKSAGIGVKLVAWDREGTWPEEESRPEADVFRVGPKCPTRSAVKVATRVPRFWFRAMTKARRMEFDVVHANDFDTLPLGIVISKLRRKPLLYDAHELYAKMIEAEAGPFSRLVGAMERRCIRTPDEVITVSDSLASELEKHRGSKVRVVTTSQDPTEVLKADRQTERAKHGLKGFVISYLGALEPGRFVEELLTSFTPEDKVNVLVAGYGTLEPTVIQATRNNPVVRFIGRVDSDEALRLTRASDLTLAMMDPSNPNNLVGTPGKIINSLAVGIPVITTKGLQIGDRVERAGAGIVIPFDRSKFVEAVLKAAVNPRDLEEMGRKGRQLYENEFSSERSREELLSAYRGLLKPAKSLENPS